jgi:hypothetical protein
MVHCRRGEAKMAQTALEKAAGLTGGNLNAAGGFWMAAALARQGHREAAESWFERAAIRASQESHSRWDMRLESARAAAEAAMASK